MGGHRPPSSQVHNGFRASRKDTLSSSVASGITEFDFEGDPRLVLNRIDIGADEFCDHLYYMGNIIPGMTIDLWVIGGPGMPVLLAMGDGVQDPPIPTPYGDLISLS